METQTKAEDQTIAGTELIEVSPLIHKISEKVRELTGDNSVAFYRFVIRVGLQRKIGDLIRVADQVFTKATKRPGMTVQDLEASVGLRNRALKSLEYIKAEIEAL